MQVEGVGSAPSALGIGSAASMDFYSFLDYPPAFRMVRAVLGAGAQRRTKKLLTKLLTEVTPGTSVLDVGCGPRSWLDVVGIEAVGSDISDSYMRSFSQNGDRLAVVNSADALPFAAGSFDSVWCMALFHHLSDETAQKALREMIRVCRPGGYIVIVDAVMPRHAWARPHAYAIRRLDRGRFVRSEAEHVGLLRTALLASTMRVNGTDTGLESIWAWAKLDDPRPS